MRSLSLLWTFGCHTTLRLSHNSIKPACTFFLDIGGCRLQLHLPDGMRCRLVLEPNERIERSSQPYKGCIITIIRIRQILVDSEGDAPSSYPCKGRHLPLGKPSSSFIFIFRIRFFAQYASTTILISTKSIVYYRHCFFYYCFLDMAYST